MAENGDELRWIDTEHHYQRPDVHEYHLPLSEGYATHSLTVFRDSSSICRRAPEARLVCLSSRSRDRVVVYRIREPNPRGTERVLVERSWSLKFPGSREDAESCFVLNDVGYLITKRAKNGFVTIYRFSLNNSASPIVLQQVTRIRVAGDVTAADVSV